jgi:WD40 repeat protein
MMPNFSYDRPHFSPDSRSITTQEKDGGHLLRDIASGEIQYHLPLGFSPVHVGQGGREIIGFSQATSRIVWWDAVHASEVKSFPCPSLQQVAHAHWLIRVTQDGQTWLALDAPGTIGLHRSSDGGLISSWQVPEMNGQIERDGHVALSRDGRSAAWNPTGSHTVWLLRPGQPPYALKGHSLRLSRIEFSPDGQTLATASVDHTIRLWDTTSGHYRATLPGHFEEVSDIGFSPDGRSLASIALGDSTKIWQLPLGRELICLENPTCGGNLVFSPDGRSLAISRDWQHPYGPNQGLVFLHAP